jgi:hypothetical protein
MIIAHSSSTQKEWKKINCIDFRKLNAATMKDPDPLPFSNEI